MTLKETMNNLLWLKKGYEQVPNRFSLILQTDLKQAVSSLVHSCKLVFTAANLSYGQAPNTQKLPFMAKMSMLAWTALMRSNSEEIVCTGIGYRALFKAF